MTIEGELTVRLDWDGRRVRRATIRSSRPALIGRVLAGRTPADAAAMVPLLFSLCAGAQGAAAASALDAAAARAPDAPRLRAREATALLEAVQEHFWRVLIDWPQAMGHAPAAAAVGRARRQIAPALARAMTDTDAPALVELARALDALAAEFVFGMAPAAWLALPDLAALTRWSEGRATLPAALLAALLARAPELGASDVPLLPAASVQALATAIVPALQRDAGFAAAPVWNDAPAETGPLARQQDHPLVALWHARHGSVATTRMIARLAELALLLGRMGAPSSPTAESALVCGIALADGEGLAATQTARGLLLHRARLAGGRVAAYEIVAPTEWNFHPHGAAVHGLARLAAAERAALARDARIAVAALDPCVACHVEVADA